MIRSAFVFILLCISSGTYSQYTAIPDTDFEERLIFLGIDSEGTIDGQVLTNDIDSVISLDLSYLGITDLTGIEDFTALEVLDYSFNYPYSVMTLNLNSNLNLKELNCSNSAIYFLEIDQCVNLQVLHHRIPFI